MTSIHAVLHRDPDTRAVEGALVVPTIEGLALGGVQASNDQEARKQVFALAEAGGINPAVVGIYTYIARAPFEEHFEKLKKSLR